MVGKRARVTANMKKTENAGIERMLKTRTTCD